MVDPLTVSPLVRGFVFALLGVGFWVGGLVFFNWVWNHYRNGSGP